MRKGGGGAGGGSMGCDARRSSLQRMRLGSSRSTEVKACATTDEKNDLEKDIKLSGDK